MHLFNFSHGAGKSKHVDPNFGSVIILMHMEGSNDGINFVEKTGFVVANRYGNAITSTTQKRFGSSSAYFDGSGDAVYVDATRNYPEVTLGIDDFTIEFFIYPTTNGTLRELYGTSNYNGTNNYLDLSLTNTNNLQFRENAVSWIVGTTPIIANNWYHVAISRASNITRIFLDGTQQGISHIDNNFYETITNRPVLGASARDWSSNAFSGYIDELRVTKGIARYVTNFTAPTESFPDS